MLGSARICGTGGRPRTRPLKFVADKAYSSGKIRAYLEKRGIEAVIPSKKNEKRRRRFDRAAYRKRARVEHEFSWLKEWRSIATRYDKLATVWRSVIVLACIMRLIGAGFSDTP